MRNISYEKYDSKKNIFNDRNLDTDEQWKKFIVQL